MPPEIEDDDDLVLDPPSQPAAAETPAPATPPPAAAQAPAAQPAPAAAATPPSVRDWAKQHLGYDEEHADDASFLQSLVAARRSAAERIQQLEAERLQWQRSQQPAQPAPAKPDPLAAFKAPEFDPRWLNMVEFDPITKNIRSKPGVDPSIASKVMAAQQWQADFAQRFSSDPLGVIRPVLEHVATELFEKQFSGKFQGVQAQQEAQQFVASNSDWLFAHDSANKQIINPQTGRPILSQDGQKFYGYLRNGAELGMPPAAQQEYARAMLARDVAMPHLQAATAGQQGDKAKQALVDKLNRRTANQSGSTVAADGTGHTGAPQNKKLPFAEQLKQQFEAEGITDEVFQAV